MNQIHIVDYLLLGAHALWMVGHRNILVEGHKTVDGQDEWVQESTLNSLTEMCYNIENCKKNRSQLFLSKKTW